MKDSAFDATAVGRAPDTEGFANRKLIRPTLSREFRSEAVVERREPRVNHNGRKTPPAEQTHAENFYYQKQIQSRTPMVIVLRDGEAINGIIEWYDKSCLKIIRPGHSNMLVYKASIKYMFKQGEDRS